LNEISKFERLLHNRPEPSRFVEARDKADSEK
jgi:hypothetical protein